jgi:hypothetical protein
MNPTKLKGVRMGTKNNVFLSYSVGDKRFTTETIEKLASLGLIQSKDDVFDVTDTLNFGGHIRDAVRNSIGAASTVVVLWSEAASHSAWVNYEAGMANALGKRIIVVLPDDKTVPIPLELKDAEIIKLKEVA